MRYREDMVDDSDSLHVNPVWLVATKLEPSRANIDLVQRPRLIETLNQSLNRKLALITAPAGFGKSTLMYQWFDILKNQSIICGWLTLDENDTDERQFLSYIVLSMVQAGIDVGSMDVGARNGFSESPTRNILSGFLQKIAEHKSKCVLLLDDYQTILGSPIDDMLSQIIEEMPQNLTLVINSRVQPYIDLPALIATGELVQITANDIRLSKDETLSTLGDSVSQDDIEDIFERTEGWPVAVQLVRFHKNSQLIKNSPIGAGSSDLVASYLTDQVISTLDEDIRDFLLHVAVLENFNPALANAVREQHDSWDILARIGSFSAFLISIPREGDWFRLHHLIAEYLRETLKRKDNKAIDRIQSRASEWYEERGQLIEAVKYAVRVKDYERCKLLFLKAGGWKIILNEGISAMRNLLRLIPDSVVSSSGRLLIARAYLHCKDGEYLEARGVLAASQALRAESDGPAYDRDYKVLDSLISLYEEHLSWLSGAADEHIDIESDGDNIEKGTLFAGHILANIALQKFGRAEEGIQNAFKFFRRSESILGVNYCYLHAGTLATYRADFDLALANIHQALELSESNFGSDSGLKHLSTVMSFAIKMWLGKFKSSNEQEFLTSFKHITIYDGWSEVFLFGLDAAYQYAAVSANQPFQDAILSIITDLSKRRHLVRMNGFMSALKIDTVYDKDTAPAEVINDWASRIKIFEEPSHWQAHYMALTKAAEIYPANDADFIILLDNAVKLSNAKDNAFHNLRLTLAKALYLNRSGQIEESYTLMTSLLRRAVAKRIILPFLNSDKLIKILRDTRNELRSRSEELILIAFVSDILGYYETIKPETKKSLLSNRELDIMQQLALGKSNKEIARVFELTENTVKFHLKSIYKKLDVNSRTQSIMAAQSLGLIE